MDLSVAFLGTGGAVPSARRIDRERAGRARRRTAAVRLRRGDAAADAALARAGPGRRDLLHPLPRRSLSRPAGAAQNLRPDRAREATDGLRAARAARPLPEPRPGDRQGRLQAGAGRARAGRRRYLARAPRFAPSRSSTACAPTATPWSRTSGRGASTRRPRSGSASGRPGLRRPAARGAGGGPVGPGRPRRRDGRVASRPHGRRSPATRPPAEATVEVARGAELLVHDASFSEEEAQRAADTGHSTVGQAAAVAREAEVKTARPRSHLLALPRRQGARGGPRGLRAHRRPPRLRPRRDPLPGARRAPAGPKRRPRKRRPSSCAASRCYPAPSFNPVPRGQEGASK